MTGNRLWNYVLKLGLVAWLYTGKIFLTLIHALYWDLELPSARRNYMRAIRAINSPTELKNSLTLHFNYRSDPLGGLWDFYYLPHITWALRTGDCDDFAWMAADVLSQHGISSIMATFIPQKITESHVIVVYQIRGKWFWSEVGFWYQDRFHNPQETILDAAQSLGGLRAVHSQSFTPTHRAGEVFSIC